LPCASALPDRQRLGGILPAGPRAHKQTGLRAVWPVGNIPNISSIALGGVAVRTEKLERMAYRLLSDPALFSRFVVGRPLRPYQLEPARAILESVLGRRGETISVMMSRQAGKNELSAQ